LGFSYVSSLYIFIWYDMMCICLLLFLVSTSRNNSSEINFLFPPHISFLFSFFHFCPYIKILKRVFWSFSGSNSKNTFYFFFSKVKINTKNTLQNIYSKIKMDTRDRKETQGGKRKFLLKSLHGCVTYLG
jgi:hypothetical protein